MSDLRGNHNFRSPIGAVNVAIKKKSLSMNAEL